MARVVQKFGGTSVADVECIRKAAKKAKAEVDANANAGASTIGRAGAGADRRVLCNFGL